MATERQIAANRLNAARSTGPKTEQGQARSRLNGTTHGLAGTLVDVEAARSPEFLDRRAKWGAEHQPEGEAAGWALDRAVAASFRIERCEHAIEDHIATVQTRAELSWEEDRSLEAATLLGRLERDPIRVSRQLQTTLAGVVLLMEAWMLLLGVLEPGRDWSESERSRALDLLGLDRDLRDGRMPVDAPEGSDSVEFRTTLVLDELDRLETLRDQALTPIDEMERRQAIKGDVALLSKPAKLLLRYERESWKQYNRSMKEMKNPDLAVAPAPVVVSPPKPPVPAVAPPRTPVEEPRRVEALSRMSALDLADEDAMLDELERRMGILDAEGPFAPDRTQFVNFAVGRAC